MPDKFFFLHMQKTAGTSLYRHLRNVFTDDQIVPSPTETDQPGINSNVDQLRRSFAEREASVRLVSGHFPLCTLDLLGGDFRVFTILRDPVERTLSLLRQHQQTTHADRSLEEIYTDPFVLHALVHNHMVKMLTLRSEDMRAGMHTMMEATPAHLDAAKEALVERVEVLGLQSDFDGFCDRLESTFGWDLGSGPRLRWNKTKPAPADESLRAMIARDNAIDIELYAHATTLVPDGNG